MEISSDRDFLGSVPFYVFIRDLVRRLCHKMIACSISSRGHEPEKVTGVDLFYLYSMDRRTANIPYLLTQYPFRHAKGRKSRDRLSRGHFIGRLAAHFGLEAQHMFKGWRYMGLGSLGPERPQADTVGARGAAEDAHVVDEGAHAVPALTSVSTWMISCMTQLMDSSGHTYQAFDSTLVGSLRVPYQRHVRPRTGDANISIAPHTDDQPNP
uniref:Uncharacterized protein n=1 Tax=Tanacetum cinerariifolium TaxID=118510 RepID=A0A6L2JR72_TANCI|nr:hypothetical protein [Tanacetum cinerariifolium]